MRIIAGVKCVFRFLTLLQKTFALTVSFSILSNKNIDGIIIVAFSAIWKGFGFSRRQNSGGGI